jgi:hypothetical protein
MGMAVRNQANGLQRRVLCSCWLRQWSGWEEGLLSWQQVELSRAPVSLRLPGPSTHRFDQTVVSVLLKSTCQSAWVRFGWLTAVKLQSRICHSSARGPCSSAWTVLPTCVDCTGCSAWTVLQAVQLCLVQVLLDMMCSAMVCFAAGR